TLVGDIVSVHYATAKKRALYLVPMKALAEEKYHHFGEMYGELGVKTIISTHDRKEYDQDLERKEFHIAVVVFEKLNALLVKNPNLLEGIGLVVIDELQMMGDDTRGAGLELLLTKILVSPFKPQLLGLSPVLGDAEDLASWLKAELLIDIRRPVELRKGILSRNIFTYLEHNSGIEGEEEWPAMAGVLIRNAEALEVLEKIDTLIVDKTGTLTEGKPRLVSIATMGNSSESELLKIAASLERGSEHPLAAAIVAGAQEKGLQLSEAREFKSLTGRGIAGVVDNNKVALGNVRLLDELNVNAANLTWQAEELRRDGQTVMFVAIDGRAAGLLGVADPIKKSTPEAIQDLHKERVRIVMLTGDSRTTAEAVAKKLSIDEVRAEVLPDQKREIVKILQSENRMVAMAGDGVNDAPALAQAHVGIAMGTGTDVAMESAGVTLVKGDLRGIVKARRLSRATMRNIRQNLFFAFVYNVLGVPIAAGALYPFFGILLSPIIASAAMTLSSVSVIANALRLRRISL
ncbi:MAG TPA: heavy metal translocating P-type ATPase, partial [Candidatus Udaeobacter sp.]|nr:heavy metal translocating P-type ATPase [Candidatus Udaeobacter sp.]